VKPLVEWAQENIILDDGKLIRFEPHQRRILNHCFKFNKKGKLPYSVIIYSCPKKSGKTELNAIVQAYFAYNVEPPNELITAANKREQAISRAFKRLKVFIERNPFLHEQVLSLTGNLVTLRNGTTILAIPNDASGEAGSNHGLTCWDEIWGFVSERNRRLWDELCPVPTRLNSIRFVSTYAGFVGESTLLEEIYSQVFTEVGEVREGVKRPLGVRLPCYAVGDTFLYWDHEARMPWQTASYYESQKRQLRPYTFLRLHENRWVSSESGLFDMDRWDDCVLASHSPPLPDKRISLYVGVDASTKKDRTAVVSVYKQDGKVLLGPKRFWQPSKENPMDLEETIEAYLLELHKGYRILRVNYDPFQFHRSATTLTKKGLPMREYPQTIPNLTACGQNIYDLVQSGNIILYPCKDLRYEASCAIGKETSRGFRIAKESTSAKVDQIVALAMAAVEASAPGFDTETLSWTEVNEYARID
jgi:phage terminase large subunit-like protein